MNWHQESRSSQTISIRSFDVPLCLFKHKYLINNKYLNSLKLAMRSIEPGKLHNFTTLYRNVPLASFARNKWSDFWRIKTRIIFKQWQSIVADRFHEHSKLIEKNAGASQLLIANQIYVQHEYKLKKDFADVIVSGINWSKPSFSAVVLKNSNKFTYKTRKRPYGSEIWTETTWCIHRIPI